MGLIFLRSLFTLKFYKTKIVLSKFFERPYL